MQMKLQTIQDLELLINDNNYPTNSRNYATIQLVCPDTIDKQEIFSKINRVALGVSLGSPMVLHNKFLAAIKLLNKFEHHCILIGDSIYRYTLQIQHGMSANEAEQYALKISNITHTHQMNQIEKQSLKPTEFVFMSKLEQHPYFEESSNIIQSAFRTNETFRKLCDNFSNHYFSRILSNQNTTIEHIELSYKYLLKELAIFSVLRKIGYTALAYPGHIATIAEILVTKIPELKSIFQDFYFISIRIKR
jgi:tRNA-dependent cyclodipeptide synthase